MPVRNRETKVFSHRFALHHFGGVVVAIYEFSFALLPAKLNLRNVFEKVRHVVSQACFLGRCVFRFFAGDNHREDVVG